MTPTVRSKGSSSRFLCCPAGVSLCHCVTAFSCPAGYERSLGLRIERSPPTRLRMRPSVPLAARTLVVRPSAAHVSTQRLARSGPARSGAMAPSARGAEFTTTPRSRLKRSRGPATEQLGPGSNVSSRRVGVSNRPAGASGHASAGCGLPSGRLAAGYRWRGFIRTARGPTAGRPCPAAGGIAAGGVSARRERGRASAEWPRTRRATKSLTQ